MQTQVADKPIIAYQLHGNCYLNITNRCTLRCAFCPKFNKIWEVQGYSLRTRHEPSAGEILAAVGDPAPYKEIVFCGLGEPTLRLAVLLQVAEQLKAQGARIRVNTDGLASLVYGRDIPPELKGKVDALSISLNAHDEITYSRHCRPLKAGAYQSLMGFIKSASRQIPDVTVTAINGLEGVDMALSRQLAEQLGAKFRQRELDEVG
ncbi:MAG: TatD family nuclease-associated radical SAM protein [Pseudomonadota bacterium]